MSDAKAGRSATPTISDRACHTRTDAVRRIIKGSKQQDYGQRAFVFADTDGNRIDAGQRN